ncbi:hypothetical protein MKX03_001298, partial [Papaver bracteatum]
MTDATANSPKSLVTKANLSFSKSLNPWDSWDNEDEFLDAFFDDSEEGSHDTQMDQSTGTLSSPNIPVITLDKDTKDRIRHPWRRCLIGK